MFDTYYLGEKDTKVEDSIFKDYTPADWALFFIGKYGGIDGAHHKDWVLDQVARILNGAEIGIKTAMWDNGLEEDRVHVKEPSEKYHNWVDKLKSGEDGPDTYSYEVGIAP